MTTMTISVPDEMKAFIEERMAEDGFASASEYLCSLIRNAQERNARQVLEAKLQEALDSGPATPMTREDWEGLERDVLARSEREQTRQ